MSERQNRVNINGDKAEKEVPTTMSMDITKFQATTYARKPFQVLAVEVNADNIEALSEYIGELRHKNGTPYIQSDKKLVGNAFKVWPGFFVTLLNGKTRCYSRRVFNEQFVDHEEFREQIEIINGNAHVRQTENFLNKLFSPETDVVGDAPEESVPNAYCEHGHADGECPYRNCVPYSDTDAEDGDDGVETMSLSEALSNRDRSLDL